MSHAEVQELLVESVLLRVDVIGCMIRASLFSESYCVARLGKAEEDPTQGISLVRSWGREPTCRVGLVEGPVRTILRFDIQH